MIFSSSKTIETQSSKYCPQATLNSTTNCTKLLSKTKDRKILPTSAFSEPEHSQKNINSNSTSKSINHHTQQYEKENLLWPKRHFQTHRFPILCFRYYQTINWLKRCIHSTSQLKTIRQLSIQAHALSLILVFGYAHPLRLTHSHQKLI